MSNRIQRFKEYADIVFKKAPRSLDVFIVLSNKNKSDEIKYVAKEHVERALRNGRSKVVVLDEDGTSLIAINYLDNV